MRRTGLLDRLAQLTDAIDPRTSIDELLEIDGIGEKTLARLTPYVTV